MKDPAEGPISLVLPKTGADIPLSLAGLCIATLHSTLCSRCMVGFSLKMTTPSRFWVGGLRHCRYVLVSLYLLKSFILICIFPLPPLPTCTLACRVAITKILLSLIDTA
ncbi:hypothetical protein F4820DRAFT_331125 [Hypoxylon rubiginosum]|uniref:Uncharacterized protein n=1 Tax=Hypoxylon rubiginosum TaxID=110542 RepID=A0ACB9YYY9_9PEZI|nr:hypothetical protein F4820DRAFT_331125 [Hypoxylon rubiginosum]